MINLIVVSALFAFLPVTTLNQYRHTAVVIRGCVELWAYYNCDTSTIRARFDYDSTTIRLQHATTRYEVLRALAYEIDSSTPRESVVGVSCMLIDSSIHTIFTLYLYRPTLHRVCEYARNCLYKHANMPSIQLITVKL